MRKRIGLLILGLVLFVGAFLTYQLVTSATFQGIKTPPPPKIAQSKESFSFEALTPEGDPLYEIRARRMEPHKDPATGQVVKNQFDVLEPSATWYIGSGKILFLRADSGVFAIDQTGKKPKPFGGRLTGNVKVVM